MKSKSVAYLLWFFLGGLSVHKFYLGKIGSGVLYLFTGQLFVIGWIVDGFTLGSQVDHINTKSELKEIRTATMANAVANSAKSE